MCRCCQGGWCQAIFLFLMLLADCTLFLCTIFEILFFQGSRDTQIVGKGILQPISLFLCPLFVHYVNLCAHLETQCIIAWMSPLWQAGYSRVLITFKISYWLELELKLHFVIFSVHICVNRIHWLQRHCAMPWFLMVRTRFSFADPTLPVF